MADKLHGKQILDGSVDTAQLADGSVTTTKLDDLGVTGGKIADGAVSTSKINNGAVDENKLATSVAGDGLTGGGGAALAVGERAQGGIDVQANSIGVSVTGALEVETGTPGSLDVKDGGIDTARLADNAVTQAKMADDAVGSDELDLTDTYDFATAGGTVRVSTPSNDNDAANKSYVDNLVQGIDAKDSVVAKTDSTSDMSGYSFSGGEWTGVTSAPTFDGVTLSDGDRCLVQHGDADLAHPGNGIFKYDATNNKLVRTDDADTWNKLISAFTFVEKGTNNADTGWTCTIDAGGTLNTTDITWAQFSGAGDVTAGQGLAKSGNTLYIDELANSGIDVQADGVAANVDDSTIEIAAGTPGTIRLKDDGVTGAKLAPAVAGNGLKQDGSGNLEVEPADFAGNGLEDDGSDNLRIKPDTTDGASVAVDSSGVRAALPYRGDKDLSTNSVSTEGGSTGISPSVNPAGDGYITVFVNIARASIGDGTKTGKACYFSTDGGSTAQNLKDVTTSSILYWNATTAGYNLVNGSDTISLHYHHVS